MRTFENGEDMVKDSREPYTDQKYTVDFTIRHCPKGLYLEFLNLRKFIGENSNWMTLKVLLEAFKKGGTYDLIAECLNSLDSRVAKLECDTPAVNTRIVNSDDPEVETVLTLGRGNKVETVRN